MIDRVVRMWRDNGIFVFNVYQGEMDKGIRHAKSR